MPATPSRSRPSVRRQLAGLLPLGLAGCSADGKNLEQAPALEELPVVTLQTTEQELFHNYVADAQAVRNVEVRVQVAGFLKHIYVDEGRSARKGLPLFRLNTSAYQSKLSRAGPRPGSGRGSPRGADPGAAAGE